MKLALTVLRWSVIGALTSAVIMALYRYYIITSSGFSVVSVPIKTMMIDVMGLPLYAGMGAGVGGLLGILIAVRAALSARKRRPDAAMDTASPTLETLIPSSGLLTSKKRNGIWLNVNASAKRSTV